MNTMNTMNTLNTTEKRPHAQNTGMAKARTPAQSNKEIVDRINAINESPNPLLRTVEQLRHDDIHARPKSHKPSAQSATEPSTKIQRKMSQLPKEHYYGLTLAAHQMLLRCQLTAAEIFKRHANLANFGTDKYGRLIKRYSIGDHIASRFSLPMRRRSPISTADIVVLCIKAENFTLILLAEEASK